MGGLVYRYEVVDVFTDTPLEGNPVAVFTDAPDLPADVMQRTAREMNLSETVFVLDGLSGSEGAEAFDARIRIFTPAVELPFAGHPVLGTAFVIGAARGLDLVRLKTGVGVIPVRLSRDGDRVVYGEMEQPVPRFEPFERADEVLAAVGAERSELPVTSCRNGPMHVYVALRSEQAVAALDPDLSALGRLEGVGVSCFAGGGGRFKTRMFGPGVGVAEDPATGSAAGPLAVHLALHGWSEYGSRIEIHQGEEIGRPSVLYALVEGSTERIEKVVVGGGGVVVARGEYRLG